MLHETQIIIHYSQYMWKMIRRLSIISHFLNGGLFLHCFLCVANGDQINDISYMEDEKLIYLSLNICFNIDQQLYSLLCSFPMKIVYARTQYETGKLALETARHKTNGENTSYHYFFGNEAPIITYYITIERIEGNRYKGCSSDNSSLSLSSLPWESLTHITDYNGVNPIKKRHLQSDVQHLELWMCTKISVNALKLQEVSFIDKFCDVTDHTNYDYYNRMLCSNTSFHCCSEECIPSEWENDGEKDCFDGSDETGCDGFDAPIKTDKYICDDGELVSIEDKCNEKFECQDLSDEDDCYGNKLHAPTLKELLMNYRTIMTTNFTQETELSITHVTIYNSSKFDIYSKIDFKRLIRKISGFHNLKSLNLSHNLFYPPTKLDISLFAFLHVERFNLSYCEIKTLNTNVADIFPYLKIFDLSHNQIKEFNPQLFFYMMNLIYLNISMSFVVTDIALRFGSFKKMILDLSNNKLETVSVHFTNDVEQIDLSGNPLKYNAIDLRGTFAPAIDKLIIYGNKIDVNMLLIERLKYVKKTDLQNYTLDCSDCRILKSGVASINKIIINGTNNAPVCTLPEKYKGESVHKVNVNEFCPDPFIKTVIAVSVISLVIIVVIIIVGYKYRFEITYWIRYTKLKKRKLPSCDYNIEGYVYDAFISYCSANREWVWDVLCLRLEDCPQKYCLCLHDRDFPLGTHIFDNIEESFKKSKYCVMIISNHFIKSQWCRFELDAASMKLIQENREFLILIQLEKLDTSDIPRPLEYLLRTRTYLEWDTEKFTEDVLLERLKAALGKSIFERGQETVGNSLSELANTNV